jgi:hypothetical protein
MVCTGIGTHFYILKRGTGLVSTSRINQPNREVNHTPLSTAHVKEVWSYTPALDIRLIRLHKGSLFSLQKGMFAHCYVRFGTILLHASGLPTE